MISIEEEVEQIITLLSYSAGYTLSMYGELTLSPIYGAIEHWEVAWQEQEVGMICDYQKLFPTLSEAVQFFVEKRRYMCLGEDFVKIYNSTDKENEI